MDMTHCAGAARVQHAFMIAYFIDFRLGAVGGNLVLIPARSPHEMTIDHKEGDEAH